MAYEIPVTQARAELAELINRVVYGGERVVVTRHGVFLINISGPHRQAEKSDAGFFFEKKNNLTSEFVPRLLPDHHFGLMFCACIHT
ncbi:type II toxin-antitoxin system Phd/YefM family antitoxin, partial [Streptomyces lunaelactis]|uniref:type II toxin-antitoxin system Phd/YefM family antitoxin n=1 Tax=Streptomyces lunaelactis TaxID=1535768 RepID=UPI0020C774D7